MLNSRNWICSTFVVGAMFIAGQAKANAFYNWSLLIPTTSTGFVAGSGAFSTAMPISGQTLLSTFTGVFDGIAITALLTPGTIGSNDNLVSNTQFYLDGNGVSFSLASADPATGSDTVNLYADSTRGYTTIDSSVGYSKTGFAYASATSVPEPASMTLMIAALAGLVAVRFRRDPRKVSGARTHGCGPHNSEA